MIIALPLLGPVGVIGSVAVSVLAHLATNLRLYYVRSEIRNIDEELERLTQAAKARATIKRWLYLKLSWMCAHT